MRCALVFSAIFAKSNVLPGCRWWWSAGGAEREAEKGARREIGFWSDGSQNAGGGRSSWSNCKRANAILKIHKCPFLSFHSTAGMKKDAFCLQKSHLCWFISSSFVSRGLSSSAQCGRMYPMGPQVLSKRRWKPLEWISGQLVTLNTDLKPMPFCPVISGKTRQHCTFCIFFCDICTFSDLLRGATLYTYQCIHICVCPWCCGPRRK